MTTEVKSRVDKRLARIEGQVRGLRKMVAEGYYCVDVLTQIAAVRSALNQVSAQVATGHVQSCILGHGTSSEHSHAKQMNPEDLCRELEVTLSRVMR